MRQPHRGLVSVSIQLGEPVPYDSEGFHQPRGLIEQRAGFWQMRHASIIAAPSKPQPDNLQIARINQMGGVGSEALSVDVPLATVGGSPSAGEFGGSCDDPDGDAEFFT